MGNEIFKNLFDILETNENIDEIQLLNFKNTYCSKSIIINDFKSFMFNTFINCKDDFLRIYNVLRKISNIFNDIYGNNYEMQWYKQQYINIFELTFIIVVQDFIRKNNTIVKNVIYTALRLDLNNQCASEIARRYFSKEHLFRNILFEIIHDAIQNLEYDKKFDCAKQILLKYHKKKYIKLVYKNIFKTTNIPINILLDLNRYQILINTLIKYGLKNLIEKEYLKILLIKKYILDTEKLNYQDHAFIILDLYCSIMVGKKWFNIDTSIFFDNLVHENIIINNLIKYTYEIHSTNILNTLIYLYNKYSLYSHNATVNIINNIKHKLIFRNKLHLINQLTSIQTFSEIKKILFLRANTVLTSLNGIISVTGSCEDDEKLYQNIESISSHTELLDKYNAGFCFKTTTSISEKDMNQLKIVIFQNAMIQKLHHINVDTEFKITKDIFKVFFYKVLSDIMLIFKNKNVFLTQLQIHLIKKLFANTIVHNEFKMLLNCLTEYQKYKLEKIYNEFCTLKNNIRFFEQITCDNIEEIKRKNMLYDNIKRDRKNFKIEWGIFNHNINDPYSISNNLDLTTLKHEFIRQQKLNSSEFKNKKVKKIDFISCLLMKKCYWPKFEVYQISLPELNSIKKRFSDNLQLDQIVLQFNDLISTVTIKLQNHKLKLTIPQYELISKLCQLKTYSIKLENINILVKRQIQVLVENKLIYQNNDVYQLGKISSGDFTLKTSYLVDDIEEYSQWNIDNEINWKMVQQAKVMKQLKKDKKINVKDIDIDIINDLKEKDYIIVKDGYIELN